jgi:hypothetical protein
LRTDIVGQLGGGKALGLQIGKGLARLDRAILPRVAHKRKAGDISAMGKPHQIRGLTAAEGRSLIQNDDRTFEFGKRPVLQACRGIRIEQGSMAPKERGYRTGRHAQILAQLAGNLRPNRQSHHRPPLFARNPRDRLKHGRLARARHALHADHAILGLQNQTGRCLLPGERRRSPISRATCCTCGAASSSTSGLA